MFDKTIVSAVALGVIAFSVFITQVSSCETKRLDRKAKIMEICLAKHSPVECENSIGRHY